MTKPKTELMAITDEDMANTGPGGNYIKILRSLYDQGILKKGEITEDIIAHDDWCRIYKGKACNCDPSIVIYNMDGSVRYDSTLQ